MLAPVWDYALEPANSQYLVEGEKRAGSLKRLGVRWTTSKC